MLHIRRWKVVLLSVLLSGGFCFFDQIQPAEAQTNVRYLNQQWSFVSVDIAKLTSRLSHVGIELPVRLRGTISTTLSVGVPWGALRDAKAWRFGGTLTSRQLDIDEFTVRDIAVNIRYRDGALRLDQLELAIPPPDGNPQRGSGSVTGTAKMQLIPRGKLTASLQVKVLAIATAAKLAPNAPQIQGRLSGSLDAEVDVDDIRQLKAWEVSGPLSLADFRWRDMPATSANVTANLANGILSAENLRIVLGQSVIASDGRVNLVDPAQPWNLSVSVQTDDVASVLDTLGGLLPNTKLGSIIEWVEKGSLSGTSKLTGTLHPPNAVAAGSAKLRQLQIAVPADVRGPLPLAPIDLTSVAFDYAMSDEHIQISKIEAGIADGQITGSVTVPRNEATVQANLGWTGLRLAKLAAPINGQGQSSGEVQLSFPISAATDVSRWQLEAKLQLDRFVWRRWQLEKIQLPRIRLSEGQLSISNLSAQFAQQPISLSLQVGLNQPHEFSTQFDVTKLDLSLFQSIRPLAQLLGKQASQITGSIRATGAAEGTLNPLALNGQAFVAADTLTVSGHTATAVRCDVTATDDAMKVENLQATLYGGNVAGNGQINLGENVGGSLQLQWVDVAADAPVVSLDLPYLQAKGRTSGQLSLTIPPGTLQEKERWTASASVALEQLLVYDWQLEDIQTKTIKLDNARLNVESFSASLDGHPLQLSLGLGIESPWPFALRYQVEHLRTERFTRLPQLSTFQDRLSGKIDSQGRIEGNLRPFELKGGGTVHAHPIQFDELKLEQVRFQYGLSSQTLQITQLHADVYGGTIAGQATLPLVAAADATAQIDWQRIDIGDLAGDITDLPWQLTGSSTGEIDLSMPAGSWQRPEDWEFDAQMNVPSLFADHLLVGSIDLAATQTATELTYQASGTVFEGKLQLTGTGDPALYDQGLPVIGSAQVHLVGAKLAQAVALASPDSSWAQDVGGKVDLQVVSSVKADQGAGDHWSYRGDIRVQQPQLKDVTLATALTARLQGNRNRLQIQQLRAQLAGGELRASGTWEYRRMAAGVINLQLRRVQTQQLAALLGQQVNVPIEGSMDAQMSLSPGDVWRIAGRATMSQGKLAGVRFRGARLPWRLQWQPRSGRMQLQLSEGQFALAGGRVSGRLSARRSAAGWSLDGKYRLSRVDVGRLLKEVGRNSQYGKGRLSGTLTIGGRNIRELADVQAEMNADLIDTQPVNLPLFRQISRLVPGAAITSATRFGTGRLEARLTKGAVQVDRLSLASNQLQIYLTGAVTAAGRLRLKAVVATGQVTDPVLFEAILSQFIKTTSAGASALLAANDFLSNRVVHLEIRGTVLRPVLRIKPFESLGEETVRFFLREASGGLVGRTPAGATP